MMANEVRVKLLTVRDLEKVTGVKMLRWYEMFAARCGPAHLRIRSTIRVSETALATRIEERAARQAAPQPHAVPCAVAVRAHGLRAGPGELQATADLRGVAAVGSGQ